MTPSSRRMCDSVSGVEAVVSAGMSRKHRIAVVAVNAPTAKKSGAWAATTPIFANAVAERPKAATRSGCNTPMDTPWN